MREPSVTRDDVHRAIDDLQIGDSPLLVHSSLRSFGWVKGGAHAVIGGLLDAGCTVMTPSFSYETYDAAPPATDRPQRNGTTYEDLPHHPAPAVAFTTASAVIDQEEMGIIPATLLTIPGSVRSDHPVNSFAALGSQAEDLIASQSPDDVYAPLEMVCRLQGHVLLMGVGLEAATLIHLAEREAGRRLFIRWAYGSDGTVIEVESGGCSRGFPKLEPALAHLRRQMRVGQSVWSVYPAQAMLEAAAQIIREQPMITHCGRPVCERCADAVAGGPLT